MNDDERTGAEEATSVKQPSGEPPDADRTFDPAMTDADEANIPPASDADPEADPDAA